MKLMLMFFFKILKRNLKDIITLQVLLEFAILHAIFYVFPYSKKNKAKIWFLFNLVALYVWIKSCRVQYYNFLLFFCNFILFYISYPFINSVMSFMFPFGIVFVYVRILVLSYICPFIFIFVEKSQQISSIFNDDDIFVSIVISSLLLFDSHDDTIFIYLLWWKNSPRN